MINLWRARNLTPYGKIIVIKSLFISKITHILLSLPSPNIETLTTLDTIFKDFLWDGKIPKFRGEILESLPALGGLKLTNLIIFDASLKISWLKQLMNQNLGWAEFPIQYEILDTIRYGDNFQKKKIPKIKNKFWKDMLGSIIKLNECSKTSKAEHVRNMPLWHNSMLNIDYRKDWEKRISHS